MYSTRIQRHYHLVYSADLYVVPPVLTLIFLHSIDALYSLSLFWFIINSVTCLLTVDVCTNFMCLTCVYNTIPLRDRYVFSFLPSLRLLSLVRLDLRICATHQKPASNNFFAEITIQWRHFPNSGFWNALSCVCIEYARGASILRFVKLNICLFRKHV